MFRAYFLIFFVNLSQLSLAVDNDFTHRDGNFTHRDFMHRDGDFTHRDEIKKSNATNLTRGQELLLKRINKIFNNYDERAPENIRELMNILESHNIEVTTFFYKYFKNPDFVSQLHPKLKHLAEAEDKRALSKTVLDTVNALYAIGFRPETLDELITKIIIIVPQAQTFLLPYEKETLRKWIRECFDKEAFIEKLPHDLRPILRQDRLKLSHNEKKQAILEVLKQARSTQSLPTINSVPKLAIFLRQYNIFHSAETLTSFLMDPLFSSQLPPEVRSIVRGERLMNLTVYIINKLYSDPQNVRPISLMRLAKLLQNTINISPQNFYKFMKDVNFVRQLPPQALDLVRASQFKNICEENF